MHLPMVILVFCSCIALGSEPLVIGEAELAARAKTLREEAGAGFTVRIEKPFVVLGDEAAAVVGERARGTVRWGSERLRRDYFAKDPDAIYAIYLFKDAASYEANALRLFGEKPDSPYGYCSPRHHALVMNIATGGGTLIHEMVHAYMHGNVPDCPVWINEGLASLFEQCDERDGRIMGLVNWRLPVLQEAITKGGAPGWMRMAAMDDEDFYHGARGANYATARYLMLWLQERGLLQRFWKTWLADRATDADGTKTLRALFPGEELATVETRWRAWVMTLRWK